MAPPTPDAPTACRETYHSIVPPPWSLEDTSLIYDDYTASEAGDNPTNLRLTNSKEHDLVEKAKLEKGGYYRPKSTNSPAIDSLCLIHPCGDRSPILLMFKIVQNEKELDASVEGLRKVGELGFSSNTRRYYIMVTLGDTRPKIIVPMRDFEGEMQGEGKQKSPDEILPVFHYPVRREELFAS